MTLTPTAILPSQDDALDLVESVIARSQADGVFVSFRASDSALSRFSENQISQNLSRDRVKLTVTSFSGKRSASAATTDLTPEAIAQALRRSQDLARVAPEDPEWVPLLEPQSYDDREPGFDEAIALMSPLQRGEMVRQVCAASVDAGVEGSGTLSTEASLLAIGNSLGLRGCDRTTKAEFSYTARIENGSSWSRRTAWNLAGLPVEDLTRQTIDRAIASRNPRPLQPGTYPVIFAGAALADLLPWVIWNLDARAASEGRSFMSRTDESGETVGNRVGEPLFSPLVQVRRDPAHPLLRSGRFFQDGWSDRPLNIIQDGIPQALSYSRYWAQQHGKQPTGAFYPIAMTGSERSIGDLIAATERGIFVSRAWYVRYVNPRTLEVTGMTRDGTFWIEDGKLAYPIQNLRFNQVLPEMLREVDALATPQRFGGVVVPGVRVKAFNFSSASESI